MGLGLAEGFPRPNEQASMSAAADSSSVASLATHPMKSRGTARKSAPLRIDWRAAFSGGSAEPPEADLSPSALFAVPARSARSASSPAHPTKKRGESGGARVKIDWRALFMAERAETPES